MPKAAATSSGLYWLGLSEDAPVDNIVLGGVAFPKFTYPVVAKRTRDDLQENVRNRIRGDRIRLSSEQVDRIKHAMSIRRIWIRGSGNSRSGHIKVTHRLEPVDPKNPRSQTKWVPDPRYQPDPSHESVEKYVFMIPLEDLSQSNLVDPEFSPPTLAENSSPAA